MRIGVIGAGAIGGLVAAFLAKDNRDIFLAGHEDQVKAVKEKGLLIKGKNEDFLSHLSPQNDNIYWN